MNFIKTVKNLEASLKQACSHLSQVHEVVGLYVEKPVYGRLLSDLEKKQADFLIILESVKKETNKCITFENDLASWTEELLLLMWKEHGHDINSRAKSVKELKTWNN